MVIRSFPAGSGMTAPRLPFEKSYSAFISSLTLLLICFPFARSGLAGRDDANAFCAVCVNNHQNPAGFTSAQADEPGLGRMLILQGESKVVFESRHCLSEGYAVF